MTAITLTHTPQTTWQPIIYRARPRNGNLDCAKTVRNPFFWTVVAGGVGVAACTVAAILLPPTTALIITAVTLTIFASTKYFQSVETRKWIFCEASLVTSTLLSFFPKFSQRPWSTKITDQITLSACPMKVDGKVPRENRPRAVLSMVEPFEVQPHLMGDPITPKEWKRAGVKFLNLPTPDVTPVRRQDIKRGVRFLDKQISKGRSVTVHCLAGVGRSATVVICYLMKHRGMKPKEAVDFVRSKRYTTVRESSWAIKNFLCKG